MAHLQTGNGISLCKRCHHKVHNRFNGKPIKGEPLNARGGDDQDDIAYLYGILEENAKERGLPMDEFYYLNDDMIDIFIEYQGYPEIKNLGMSRISLAHEIWRVAPQYWQKAYDKWLLEVALSGQYWDFDPKRYIPNQKRVLH